MVPSLVSEQISWDLFLLMTGIWCIVALGLSLVRKNGGRRRRKGKRPAQVVQGFGLWRAWESVKMAQIGRRRRKTRKDALYQRQSTKTTRILHSEILGETKGNHCSFEWLRPSQNSSRQLTDYQTRIHFRAPNRRLQSERCRAYSSQVTQVTRPPLPRRPHCFRTANRPQLLRQLFFVNAFSFLDLARLY